MGVPIFYLYFRESRNKGRNGALVVPGISCVYIISYMCYKNMNVSSAYNFLLLNCVISPNYYHSF